MCGGGGTPCRPGLYGNGLPERHQFSAILVKFGLFGSEKKGFKLLGYITSSQNSNPFAGTSILIIKYLT